MFLKKGALLMVLVFFAVGFVCAGGQTEDVDSEDPAEGRAVTIQLAHDNATTTPGHKAFVDFKEMVESKTDGRITVNIFPGGQMGSVTDVFEQVRRGDVHMTVAATTLLTQTIPEFAIWDLFYLFDDAEHAHEVLDGPAGERLMEPLERYDLKGLGYMEIGFRNFSNNSRPIKKLEDLEGLRIRGYSPMQIAAWEAVGTNLTTLSWTEVFTSLQQNLIDGQECATSSFYDARFHEAQDYWSLTEHIYTNWLWFTNKNFWEGLAQTDQELLKELAEETIAIQRQYSYEAEQVALDKVEAGGVEINEVPLEAKREMGELMNEAVRDRIIEQTGQEIYDFVMEEVRRTRK